MQTNVDSIKTNRREAFSVPKVAKLMPWVKLIKEETIAAKNKVIAKKAVKNVTKAKFQDTEKPVSAVPYLMKIV